MVVARAAALRACLVPGHWLIVINVASTAPRARRIRPPLPRGHPGAGVKDLEKFKTLAENPAVVADTDVRDTLTAQGHRLGHRTRPTARGVRQMSTGVWLIGARGSVATTVVAGAAAARAGLAPSTGCVSSHRRSRGCS